MSLFAKVVNALPLWTRGASAAPRVVSLAECGGCDAPCEQHEWDFGDEAAAVEPIDYTSDMSASTKPYDAHWIISGLGEAAEWPSKIPESPFAPVISALKALEGEAKVNVTLAEQPLEQGAGSSSATFGTPASTTFDLLKMPGFLSYPNMTVADIPRIPAMAAQTLAGDPTHVVLICGHLQKDRRCGLVAGPLQARFREALDAAGLQSSTRVLKCSHVGGHKYAGNVIIFARGSDGRDGGWRGLWYGRVRLCNVEAIVRASIADNAIIKDLHRGGGF